MANMSYTKGTITIQTDDKDKLIDLILSHNKYNQESYYDTTFDDETDDRSVYEAQVAEENGLYTINLSFTGSGRWTFISNEEWFFKHIFETQPELEAQNYKVIFDYVDSEQGNDFVSHVTSEWEWDGNEAILISRQEPADAYTAENLIEYGIYSQGEIVDTLMYECDKTLFWKELKQTLDEKEFEKWENNKSIIETNLNNLYQFVTDTFVDWLNAVESDLLEGVSNGN